MLADQIAGTGRSPSIILRLLLVAGVLLLSQGCRKYCQNGDIVSDDYCKEGCVEQHTEVDGVCVLDRFIDCCACLSRDECLEEQNRGQCVASFANNEMPPHDTSCMEERCADTCYAERKGPYVNIGER